MIAVPFIPNTPDDTHCVGAVYRMVYQYIKKEDLSWDKVDEISRKEKGKGIWTFPLELYCAQHNIHVYTIEDIDYAALMRDGEAYIRSHYGEMNAAYYIQHSNILSTLDLIPAYCAHVLHQQRKATIEDIILLISKGCVVGVEVDAGRLNNREKFALHYVLCIGYENESFIIHDPGIPPYENRRVSISNFSLAFEYAGSSCGITAFCHLPVIDVPTR